MYLEVMDVNSTTENKISSLKENTIITIKLKLNVLSYLLVTIII